MKYTRIPDDTFQNLQMNAGIIVRNFDPLTGEGTGLLGATTGGVNFTATPTFEDFGEDIDNCPKNTKELKKLTEWEIKLSTTLVTISASVAKTLIAAADVDGDNDGHIIPRNDLDAKDFDDLWWIGDYSDKNTGDDAGYCAVHLMNALSTGGFQIQSTDKAKGNFALEFTAHYSMNEQDKVPFEVYVKSGGSEVKPSILLNKHSAKILVDGTETLTATKIPATAPVAWTSSSDSVATVSSGVVTGVDEGSAIITAMITVDGVEYTDTCTVIVEASEAEG
jgi:hypothetical protein